MKKIFESKEVSGNGKVLEASISLDRIALDPKERSLASYFEMIIKGPVNEDHTETIYLSLGEEELRQLRDALDDLLRQY